MRYFLLILIVLSVNCKAQNKKNKTIKNGKDLIDAMYNTYSGKWYKHFTFVQDIIHYKDGKEEKKEVWYEALSFPGNLVIKFDSLKSRNGVIFSDQKVTSIKDGKPGESRPFIHDLLLVGFDVYFLKPVTTKHLLDSLSYDLSIIHEGTFNGRQVYVIGANKGDSLSNQFWIDKERLYMHRIIYKRGKNVQDVIFGDYESIEKNWVAKSVTFTVNGQVQAIEKYYSIRFPQSLDAQIFEPMKFLESSW